jgi:curved DNA-binding protein CbpA
MPKPRFDPYAVLGVAPGASQDEIRDRYRILAHLLHPDRHQSAPRSVIEEAERHLTQVNEAYRLLSKGRHSKEQHEHDVGLRQAREREAQLRLALERQAADRLAQRRRVRLRWLLAGAAVVICGVLVGFVLVDWGSDTGDATASSGAPATSSASPTASGSAPAPPSTALTPGTYSVNREIRSDGTWAATLTDIEVDQRSRVRVAVVYRNVSGAAAPLACESAGRRNVYLTLNGGSILHAQRISCSSNSAEQLYSPGATATTIAEFGRISASDLPFSLSWYPARWGTVADIAL